MAETLEGDVHLTPHLQLAIRMLQGNHHEMLEWVQEALRGNPALCWRQPATVAKVDAQVRLGEAGELSLLLADEGSLSVSTEADVDESERRRAEWLVSAAARRRRSIERLLLAIMDHQRAFLCGREAEPAKLSHRVLAAELGYHRSTIERLVRGKSLQILRPEEPPVELELGSLASDDPAI
ncbi:MAG TPA: hypothetical protein ENJ18_09365 [Nannocystis exedens]|nr:hypothetical protein [Nannocystis exedens]